MYNCLLFNTDVCYNNLYFTFFNSKSLARWYEFFYGYILAKWLRGLTVAIFNLLQSNTNVDVSKCKSLTRKQDNLLLLKDNDNLKQINVQRIQKTSIVMFLDSEHLIDQSRSSMLYEQGLIIEEPKGYNP